LLASYLEMASNTLTLIETVITCPICLDHFKDPRLLSCTHTYCLKCIKDVALKNNGQFECPLRDGTIINKDKINSLPLNQTVREIVELLDNPCKYETQIDRVWVRSVFHRDAAGREFFGFIS
jgi:zinc finger of C3HC4-type, RING